jgi:hypothetical protein
MASGYMFSHYWPGDGVQGVVVVPITQENYPYYFNSANVSMLGMGQLSWEAVRIRIIRALPARLRASWFALRTIWSKDFTRAVSVVDAIAKDPSSRNISQWGEINRLTVSNLHHGENTYRHLLASITLDGPKAALLAELAWQGHKKRS